MNSQSQFNYPAPRNHSGGDTLSLVAFILQSLVMDATSFTITDAELIQAVENVELYYEQQITDAELIEAAEKVERYFEYHLTDTELIEAAESAEQIYEQTLTDTKLQEAAECAERIVKEETPQLLLAKEENAFIGTMERQCCDEAINMQNYNSLMLKDWQQQSSNEERP